jgi:hypothetical protein
MPPEEANLNQINRIFTEAVLVHGDDIRKVINYVKRRIRAANPQDCAEIDRIFARVTTFRAPDCPPNHLN